MPCPYNNFTAVKKLSAPAFITSLLCLLIAYGLRVYGLGAKDIWWDEAHSWWYASLPLLQGVREGMAQWYGAASDPLHLILLNLWIDIAGQTPFALRYLSLLANLLAVAYLGRVAGRFLGRHALIPALLIGAASAAWVFYAQEVRQYALTPLLMLVVAEAVLEISHHKTTSNWVFIRLAAAQALILYTHSFTAFGMVAVNLLLGLIWLRSGAGRGFLWRWVLSQVAVLIVLLPEAPNYIARAGAESGAFTQLGPAYMLNALWLFWLGIPWEQATDPLPMRLIAGGFSLLLLIALAGASAQRRRAAADLLLLCLGCAGLVMLYWLRTPIFHPRYLIFLSGPLYAAMAWAAVQSWARGGPWRALGLSLLGGWLLLSAFSLGNLYTGRYFGYRHDPAGQVAAAVIERLGPGDAVISLDPNDHTLRYYGVDTAASLLMAGLDNGFHTPQQVERFITGRGQVAVVRFHAERSDLRGAVPYLLETHGTLIDHQRWESYEVFWYVMDDAPPQTQRLPATFDWGVLRLEGAAAQAGDALTVRLAWRAIDAPPEAFSAVLRLVEPNTGWLLAQAAGPIYAADQRDTSAWQAGEAGDQYLVLPLVPGTPPIEAELRLTLLEADGRPLDLRDAAGSPAGQQATLGQIALARAAERPTYPAERYAFALRALDHPAFSGYSLDAGAALPGDQVGLVLGWHQRPQPLRIRVEDGAGRVIGQMGPPPPDRADVPWLERRLISLDADAPPGPTRLIVAYQGSQITLAGPEVQAVERLLQPPRIPNPLAVRFEGGYELLGYSLSYPQPLTDQDTVLLTLYWRAGEGLAAQGNPDYTVTAQLIDAQGVLAGQHDGQPAYGARPTGTWQPGEFIIDEHPITFNRPASGPLRIQIGLYDPSTLARLPLLGGGDAADLGITLQAE